MESFVIVDCLCNYVTFVCDTDGQSETIDQILKFKLYYLILASALDTAGLLFYFYSLLLKMFNKLEVWFIFQFLIFTFSL